MDKTKLDAHLRKRAKGFRPTVLVHPSDGAEAIARKNGLTVADMLRPFVALKEVSIPFRSSSSVTNLSEFSLRLVTPSECALPPLDVSESHLSRAVANTPIPGANRFGFSDAQISTPEDAARWLAKANKGKDGPAPWFLTWRDELDKCLRALPQEGADAPVAILCVASTIDAAGPVQSLRELLSTASLPDSFKGQFDPDVPKIILLLHDAQAGVDGRFSYSNDAAVASVAASGSGSPVLPPGCQPPHPYTSPLHGRPPVDPGSVMRELRSNFPPERVFGVAINTDTTASARWVCVMTMSSSDVLPTMTMDGSTRLSTKC